MPQWEHRKIDLNNVPRKTDDIDLLNDVGDQGWELVTITTNSMAYFKRQLEDPARTSSTSQSCDPARVGHMSAPSSVGGDRNRALASYFHNPSNRRPATRV